MYSTTSEINVADETKDTIIIHLRIDENESREEDMSFGVSAYEDNDVFVAQPLEISKYTTSSIPTEAPRYDPDDIRVENDEIKPEELERELPSSYAKKVVYLLKDFSEKNKVGEWPRSTSTLCHWCCHGFKGPPLGIPFRYDGEHFFVTGCFCSFSCAAAYNMDSGETNTVIGQRYSLLCSLASKLGCEEHIKIAPPRLSLSCFGGHLSIDEFRAFSQADRMMILNVPPMKSLTQQIEEVNNVDVGSGYQYIPIDHVRSERGLPTDLALKRNKPLLNLKNTLHSAMNVQIISGSE